MFKKFAYVSLLLLAFVIAACGSGVATYPPPNTTETIEAAVSDDSHSSEPTEQAALPTESSATVVDVEVTVEPTVIEAATIEPTVEASVATDVVEDTSVPPTLPPTEVEALPSEVPTEVPEAIATEPVSTSRAEVATIAATDTPEPTNTATDTPEPTATATDSATDTPEPTATVTNTATDTPEPTATVTNTATDTPEPTATVTNTATDTPEPTATVTNTATDTPEPTATVTNTATDTPEPTATVTNTATDTPEPTATVTNTATDAPEPTATTTSTAADTPEPTPTASNTATDTPEPTATLTDTPEPIELEPYENESLGLTFDYSPAWSEPIEDDNAIIIIPSEDIEDTSAGNVAILRGTPEEIADEFIVEVNIDTPEAFLESLADDLENVEIGEFELADGEIVATELIGVSEEDNQTIRAIVIDLEDDWIVIIGIAPTEIFEMFSADVMDVILQNLDIGERAISEPVESTQYEGEAVGLEFEYQADSEIEREDNTLTIDSTFHDVNGNIFIARGTPEVLLEQGHIRDDSNPRVALLSLEPDTDPFVSDQFNPSFQAWTITIETTEGDDTYTERLYIVAIRTEWVFIRTSALSETFDEADENIFAPLLESVIILDEIPE